MSDSDRLPPNTQAGPGGGRAPRWGRRLIIGGALWAVSPIVYAVLSGVLSGVNWADESEGSGAAIWFVFFTIPTGAAVVFVGVVVGAIRSVRGGDRPSGG